MTVFNGEELKERKFVPWLVKDATIRNSLYLVLTQFANILFTLGPIYPLTQVVIILNYTKTVYQLMSNAVTKIDLMDDGKTVTLFFGKMGKSKTVAIKDIIK